MGPRMMAVLERHDGSNPKYDMCVLEVLGDNFGLLGSRRFANQRANS